MSIIINQPNQSVHSKQNVSANAVYFLHSNFQLKTGKENSLPQKFSGHRLSELVVLLAIISTRNRRKKRKPEGKKSQCVQKKHWDSMSLWFSRRKIIFTQPLVYCVCIKGNKCIMFPAFILKLATVFLILEFHMVPETQNNFLLVISSANILNADLLATSKMLLG